MTAHADITTAAASRILVRLSKHWAHRFSVTRDATSAHIDFGDGSLCRLQLIPGGLRAGVEAPPAELEQLEQIVAEHLQRMAQGESLTISWQPGG